MLNVSPAVSLVFVYDEAVSAKEGALASAPHDAATARQIFENFMIIPRKKSLIGDIARRTEPTTRGDSRLGPLLQPLKPKNQAAAAARRRRDAAPSAKRPDPINHTAAGKGTALASGASE